VTTFHTQNVYVKNENINLKTKSLISVNIFEINQFSDSDVQVLDLK
jgi:hypothetical protein